MTENQQPQPLLQPQPSPQPQLFPQPQLLPQPQPPKPPQPRSRITMMIHQLPLKPLLHILLPPAKARTRAPDRMPGSRRSVHSMRNYELCAVCASENSVSIPSNE